MPQVAIEESAGTWTVMIQGRTSHAYLHSDMTWRRTAVSRKGLTGRFLTRDEAERAFNDWVASVPVVQWDHARRTIPQPQAYVGRGIATRDSVRKA